MKKITALIGLMGLVIVCFSQSNTQLKGPKAKNHKPWQNEKSNSVSQLVINSSRGGAKGPNVKNSKPWRNKLLIESLEVLPIQRIRLKGPKAKNHKPWQDINQY